MVRINLIQPKELTDQHLIAEYNEILMLVGYVRKYPKIQYSEIPANYKLGKGHMKFFKNKLLYLQKRHDKISLEMLERGFKPKIKLNLDKEFEKEYLNNYQPKEKDYKIIRQRIKERLQLKPNFYTYYKKPIKLVKKFKKLMKG